MTFYQKFYKYFEKPSKSTDVEKSFNIYEVTPYIKLRKRFRESRNAI